MNLCWLKGEIATEVIIKNGVSSFVLEHFETYKHSSGNIVSTTTKIPIVCKGEVAKKLEQIPQKSVISVAGGIQNGNKSIYVFAKSIEPLEIYQEESTDNELSDFP